LHNLPSSGVQTKVLGLATFGVANWWKSGSTPFKGDATHSCTTTALPPGPTFDCGAAWGYLFDYAIDKARPSTILLQRMGPTKNPIAPIFVALVE
jgi:hypothetical protein